MKNRRTFGIAVAGVVLMMAAFAFAQNPQPLQQQITVNFANPVVVGKETLPPGSYLFRVVQGSSNPTQFAIYENKGGSPKATAIASKTVIDTRVDPGTPNRTRFVLLQVNGTDYLSKLWLGGTGQGWDFLSGTDMAKKAGNEVTVEANTGSQSNQPSSMANPQ